MPDAAPHPPQPPPRDILTPERNVTHAHFRPDDTVILFKGGHGRRLWGDVMTVVTSSWHTPTDEDGWRLRNPRGGEQSYVTSSPRYLVHLARRCPDCLIYRRALEDYLLPKFPDTTDTIDLGWYSISPTNQLMHADDARSSR